LKGRLNYVIQITFLAIVAVADFVDRLSWREASDRKILQEKAGNLSRFNSNRNMQFVSKTNKFSGMMQAAERFP
jgi:hypothetical protein